LRLVRAARAQVADKLNANKRREQSGWDCNARPARPPHSHGPSLALCLLGSVLARSVGRGLNRAAHAIGQ
jgi:hypothetical protein